MATTTRPTSTKGWAKALAQPASEFALTPLPVIAGEVPAGLRGSLYRNGPARLQRGNHRVGHWFDGDGAILGVHFTGTDTTGVYRYVQTAGYQAEQKSGELMFGGYGMTPPGSIWKRFGKGFKNAANTSVLALPDKLLALWEGGHPHALDLHALETRGLDDLGELDPKWPFSAHPKRDPHAGDIYNFGVTPGKNAQLHVYRCSSSGTVLQHGAVTLDGVPLIHDFVLAGGYLVFFIPPLRMQLLPALFQLKSYSDSLEWRPEKGTQILVIDRFTLEVVSRGEAEPWYQWHFGNGYVTDAGDLAIALVRYENFQTNQYLKEIATGKSQTAAEGTLWELRLEPTTGKLTSSQKLVDRACEFPIVAPSEVGQPSRFTYLSVYQPGADIGQELLGAIARFDHHAGTLTETDLGENCYPSEPIYAPDAYHPQQGWILTVVFDAHRSCSEVWIFDGDRLDAPPVCRLALPSVVPMGFHGTWKPAEG